MAFHFLIQRIGAACEGDSCNNMMMPTDIIAVRCIKVFSIVNWPAVKARFEGMMKRLVNTYDQA